MRPVSPSAPLQASFDRIDHALISTPFNES
jgi:hypothetical protein